MENITITQAIHARDQFRDELLKRFQSYEGSTKQKIQSIFLTSEFDDADDWNMPITQAVRIVTTGGSSNGWVAQRYLEENLLLLIQRFERSTGLSIAEIEACRFDDHLGGIDWVEVVPTLQKLDSGNWKESANLPANTTAA